jgi:hypothetical protein
LRDRVIAARGGNRMIKFFRRLLLLHGPWATSFAVGFDEETNEVNSVGIVGYGWIWAKRDCTADEAVDTMIELLEEYFGMPMNKLVVETAVTQAIWKIRTAPALGGVS